MKSSIHKKMLRFAAAEAFLQLGFERTAEQALNIVADVVSYYLEAMVQRMHPFQDSSAKTITDLLVGSFYGSEQYQKEELFPFLDQQLQIRRQMREKAEDGILQHALKTLPHEAAHPSPLRMVNAISVEERARPKILDEMVLDEFLADFIEGCSQEDSRRAVTGYAYDMSVPIVSSTGAESGASDEARIDALPAGRVDDVLEVQELFLEDFSGKEKYKVFRMSS